MNRDVPEDSLSTALQREFSERSNGFGSRAVFEFARMCLLWGWDAAKADVEAPPPEPAPSPPPARPAVGDAIKYRDIESIVYNGGIVAVNEDGTVDVETLEGEPLAPVTHTFVPLWRSSHAADPVPPCAAYEDELPAAAAAQAPAPAPRRRRSQAPAPAPRRRR